jgi:hypothetical protein
MPRRDVDAAMRGHISVGLAAQEPDFELQSAPWITTRPDSVCLINGGELTRETPARNVEASQVLDDSAEPGIAPPPAQGQGLIVNDGCQPPAPLESPEGALRPAFSDHVHKA